MLANTPYRKVLIVDDHFIFREGLLSLFRAATEFKIVGTAGSVHECIEIARETFPDIILMDFHLPDGTGLDATRTLRKVIPGCKIIFLTIDDSDEALFNALRAGAKGFMLKNATGGDILAGLRGLDNQEMAISRKMISRVVEEFSRLPVAQETGQANPDKRELLTRLSKREIEVLSELKSGARNDQIAERLFLSENTVKHHLRTMFDKLGVRNRREAADLAFQMDL